MERKENVMGTKPLFPLLISMALPPIVSMLIQSMYNVVDSIFVARLSEQALTAVSLVFPLQNLSLAFSVGLGVGLNSCVARWLGSGDMKRTRMAVTHGMILAGLHGLVFIFVGLFLSRPFLAMFTEDPQILDMAVSYSVIVICWTFGSHFHIAAEKIFQAVGNMVVPMVLQGIGAIINIILDPIFIFGYFGVPAFGVRGAAIATIIGQLTACVLALILMYKTKNVIKPQWKGFHFDKRIIRDIYQVAVPSGLLVAMPSLLIGILNRLLAGFSATSVAVLGLYYKMQTFVYMPANGLIQGLRPIAGYNFGAKKIDRLKEAVNVGLKVCGVIMLLGSILFIGFPGLIMQLFGASPEMMTMGTQALRIIGLGFLVSTLSLIYSGTFEALGRGLESLIVSILRQLIIIPPLAFVLTRFMGVTGVWAAFPVAEFAAAAVALLLWKKTMKNLYR